MFIELLTVAGELITDAKIFTQKKSVLVLILTKEALYGGKVKFDCKVNGSLGNGRKKGGL